MQLSLYNRKLLLSVNLIATILIISIHYRSFLSVDLSNGITVNYYFQQLFTNSLARGAVPLFSLISGYFMIKKIYEGNLGVLGFYKDKIKTLLYPYLISLTIIYILVETIRTIMLNDYNSFSLVTYINGFISPAPVQFWFLRDLLIFSIISPVLVRLNYFMMFLITSICALCWLLEFQFFPIFGKLYLLNIEFLFFSFLGFMLYKFNNFELLLDKIVKFNTFYIFTIWFIISSLRIYIDPSIDIWYSSDFNYISLFLYKISILVSMFLIINISQYISSYRITSALSGFTFFVFLYHHLPLSYIKLITPFFIKEDYAFYFNFPFVVILTFLSAYYINKFFPALFLNLTGGRGPRKAQLRIKKEYE